ncbi:hypothetical protein JIN84_09305 [Luteolibacter yonseiensis]|uniref:Uncharacterized protein n=1 Tax=Luteolibacter yonseiensis TaxID=1144680 RepID=A0A934VA41_9BACT|nr:hypothetical protein [Luteolibacter yonseiensis]MBK1815813.1 hypothetical protein [Luteolibacter yonseiensis]
MEVLLLAAEIATALNENTKGFRECTVTKDCAGLCYTFDTTEDAELFQEKRSQALEGKSRSVFAAGAAVYEYWV